MNGVTTDRRRMRRWMLIREMGYKTIWFSTADDYGMTRGYGWDGWLYDTVYMRDKCN